jgi:hypothetical protein
MSERVNLRVEKADLKDWDEHWKDSDVYSSRSKFIQHAVNKQIRRDKGAGGDSTAQTAQTGASTERVDKLVETVERMATNIETLEDRVEDATRAMQAGGGVDEDTTTEVWSALPTAPERATTAEGIAEGMDADPNTVRVALETLHDNTGSAVEKREIQQIEEGDGTTTVTDHQGRTLEIEDSGTAVKRRNPLWWRRE